jgi:hypothetical protein
MESAICGSTMIRSVSIIALRALVLAMMPLIAPASQTPTFVLPTPTGRFGVGTTSWVVTDSKRPETFLRHAAALPELRLHDLRHSFASVPATSGESLLVVRSLLGHKRASTTERYAHLADDPVKRAADRASGDIAAWLTPNLSDTPNTPSGG